MSRSVLPPLLLPPPPPPLPPGAAPATPPSATATTSVQRPEWAFASPSWWSLCPSTPLPASISKIPFEIFTVPPEEVQTREYPNQGQHFRGVTGQPDASTYIHGAVAQENEARAKFE